ncbi:MAG: hypothetical protein BWY76_02830 [bacterium ADurb.Bin429]|nr:MAG: hypothetical protein BWY76_02830 [bacterium ADurb.Bin429]
MWAALYRAKWILTAAFSAGLGVMLVAWFKMRRWKVCLVAAVTALTALGTGGNPLAAFTVGSLGLAWTKMGKTYSGLSVKDMGAWTSVFTTAVPLPADLWRGLARAAGAHIYCESNDILLADSTIVALHSIQSGEKTIHLPGTYDVEDVVTGEMVAQGVDTIRFTLDAPETRVFRLV